LRLDGSHAIICWSLALSLGLIITFFSPFAPIGAERAATKSSSPTDPLSLTKNLEPAIVKIESPRENGRGIGSGFFISSDGYILTVSHILENRYGTVAKEIKGVTRRGKTKLIKVVATDREEDLALLKMESDDQPFPFIELGSSKKLNLLDYVMALGYPYGVFSVTEGKISALREGKELPAIQMTAPVAPGNSGGPLVDSQGAAIGIVTAKLSTAGGFNFAIGIDHAKDLIPPYRQLPPFSSPKLDFSQSGLLYWIERKNGTLGKWIPGRKEKETLASDLGRPVDLAVFERYVYLLVKDNEERQGSFSLIRYSTYDGRKKTLAEDLERTRGLSPGPEGRIHFVTGFEPPPGEGKKEWKIRFWDPTEGEIKDLFGLSSEPQDLVVGEKGRLYPLFDWKTAEKEGESNWALFRYERDGSGEKLIAFLPPSGELDYDHIGQDHSNSIYYVSASSKGGGLYQIELNPPHQVTKLKEGDFLTFTLDKAGNFYLLEKGVAGVGLEIWRR